MSFITPVLSTSYNVGLDATAQTLTLLDTKGGQFVIDGTNVGFTGSVAIKVLGSQSVIQNIATTGSPTAFAITAGAHTTLTATVEDIDININLSATKQWAAGAITTQRDVVVQARTYAFAGASTVTTAATFAITGAPGLGANATITNPLAFWVQAGKSAVSGFFGIQTTAPSSALEISSLSSTTDAIQTFSFPTVAIKYYVGTRHTDRIGLTCNYPPNSTTFSDPSNVGAHIYVGTSGILMGVSPSNGTLGNSVFTIDTNETINLCNPATASASSALQVRTDKTQVPIASATSAVWDGVSIFSGAPGVNLTGNTAITTATGFNMVTLGTPSIAGNTNTCTISFSATLAIKGAPVKIGTQIAITNSYAFWVQGGNVRLDGGVLTHGTDINSAGPYTVLGTDYYLCFRYTSTGAITANLPSIATVGDGFTLYSADSGYNAAANNITISPNGADKVNNAASYTQSVTGSVVMLRANNTTKNWEVMT